MRTHYLFIFLLTLGGFLFFASSLTFAQRSPEDVLYLKNGWILRGDIKSTVTDSLVIIQTNDRNQFVFRHQEIDSARQEWVQDKKSDLMAYKRRGFSHYTELGALAGNNTNNLSNASAFSFQMVNGYKFAQAFFVGFGIGVDLYPTQTFLPVFGSIRGDLSSRGKFIPYYFMNLGYGSSTTSTDSQFGVTTTYKGGALFGIGLGMKVIFANNTGFLLSVGHHSQKASMYQDSSWSTNDQEMSYQRLSLRAGFTF